MRRDRHARTHAAAMAIARAFTLVELLIVIAIIAVLLAILLPTLGGVRTAARRASTQTLMRDVANATDMFRTQEGRLPGRFGPRDMGDVENADDHGVTAMENALLDLSAADVEVVGVSSLPAPADDNAIIDVGPRSDTKVRLDQNFVGSGTGASYLTLDAAHLRPVEGQITLTDRVIGDRLVGMPDVIDDFGQPLLLWVRDQTASLPPAPLGDPGDKFALEVFDRNDPERASFYWASNAGYLRSGAPGLPTTLDHVSELPDKRPGLGEDRIDQNSRSILGGENRDTDDEAVPLSLMGILGSPAFSTEYQTGGDLPRPTASRGDAVVISAGPDQIFFERPLSATGVPATETEVRTVGYPPREAVSNDNPLRTVEDFDDLIQSSGG